MLLLASCGQPGSPIAPSLELPRAVEDLSATRKGDKVTLRWTPPNRFTDGRMVRQVGPTHICRSTSVTPPTTCTVAATMPPLPNEPKKRKVEHGAVEFEDSLPPALLQPAPTGFVNYGVEVLNTHGRAVGISNQIRISTAPAIAPPANLATRLSDAGVTLSWGAENFPSIPELSFVYQISRKGEAGEFAPIATVSRAQSNYTDTTVEWEKKSQYRVAVLTQSQDGKLLVEGDDSAPIEIFAHDVFPPAAPRELQAVFSGPGQQIFIDLSWTPGTEQDLAGYNVFRSEEGAAPQKLNSQLVTSPSFRDQQVVAGKTYVYAITAVDARGNESEKSSETSERVP
jgi:hypothetical protein